MVPILTMFFLIALGFGLALYGLEFLLAELAAWRNRRRRERLRWD